MRVLGFERLSSTSTSPCVSFGQRNTVQAQTGVVPSMSKSMSMFTNSVTKFNTVLPIKSSRENTFLHWSIKDGEKKNLTQIPGSPYTPSPIKKCTSCKNLNWTISKICQSMSQSEFSTALEKQQLISKCINKALLNIMTFMTGFLKGCFRRYDLTKGSLKQNTLYILCTLLWQCRTYLCSCQCCSLSIWIRQPQREENVSARKRRELNWCPEVSERAAGSQRENNRKWKPFDFTALTELLSAYHHIRHHRVSVPPKIVNYQS